MGGYRPQHCDFKSELEKEKVPYYIPTAEEIGCTPEELARSLNPFAYNAQMKDALPPPWVDHTKLWLPKSHS